MKRILQCGIVVLMGIVGAENARADVVTDWNEMAFRAAVVANTPALNMTRFAAIVQAAVFDAVNGIDRRYTPIHVAAAGPAGASRRAAAVQAAYVILVKLYGQAGNVLNQQQTLDARLAASLAEIAGDGAASIQSGRAWGQTVADAIWTSRLNDGFTNVVAFPGNTALGQWRQTPNEPYAPLALSAAGIGYKQFSEMTPWVIASPSQFRPAGPPALNSAQYAKDFNEVKLMGSRDSTSRTTDQTLFSWFWATGTASYLWNRTALSILEARRDDGDDRRGDNDREDEDDRGRGRGNSLLENARLLAALNVAMADAAIGCWDAKYIYNFWRPISAIRELSDDGNPATTPDSAWKPLFSTPGHPDYPSGHSCVSGAATTVLANEFGERRRFDMTIDLNIGVTRSFRSFTEALDEVKNARIFAGIHFRTACDDGTTLGKAVAQYVLAHAFQRVH